MRRTPDRGASMEIASADLFSRRRFLARLGLLAGGAALAPLAHGLGAGVLRRERLEVSRPALGTWMRVVVNHSDPALARRAVEDAFAAVRAVDAQMSVHRADSQLMRVNALAGREARRVDHAVLEVVARALSAAERTGGVYDPTVLPLMRLFGFYGPAPTTLPTAREVDTALACMGSGSIRLDPAGGRLGLSVSGAGLDLGSIGKGWAVDRAVESLRARGVRSALVDLGGNVYGLGRPDDEAPGWSVGVFHPATGALERVFVLHDRAVASSGNSEQFRVLGDTRIGHLFDARRGTPANGHLSASVVAPSGVESDIGSTVAFLLGPDRFRGWPGAIETCFIG